MKVLLLRLRARLALAAALALCLVAPQVACAAFSITPSSAIDDGPLKELPSLTGLLYKAEVTGSKEEGTAKGFYSTVFNDTATDPSGAVISWDGGSYISDPTKLLVKDGNQVPAWYLFDITGWDGQEEIVLSGFWPQQGAISFVAIYGSSVTSVPEPASMTMVALGVTCLAGRAYKRRRRAAKSLEA